jgi:hypothetical protein
LRPAAFIQRAFSTIDARNDFSVLSKIPPFEALIGTGHDPREASFSAQFSLGVNIRVIEMAGPVASGASRGQPRRTGRAEKTEGDALFLVRPTFLYSKFPRFRVID